MADPESVNFFHENIKLVFTGVAFFTLWLLKTLGKKVVAQYVTRDQLFKILQEHSESVKKERTQEMRDGEKRIIAGIIKELKNDS